MKFIYKKKAKSEEELDKELDEELAFMSFDKSRTKMEKEEQHGQA